MRTQRFGIEIEMTGITREKAAETIAAYFGTESFYLGTYYKTYGAKDRQGRTWKATYDSSIIAQKKSGGRTVNVCVGKVNMLCPDGRKLNINGEEKIQGGLWRQYFQNKNCLRLVLEIPNPTDYMNIVSYYAGDC